MQSIAEKLLTEADALSMADSRELTQFMQQAKAAKPLWDRQPILNRTSPSKEQAVDEGDNAPASWDHAKDATMPAEPAQSQVHQKSAPRTPSLSADTGAVSTSPYGAVPKGSSLLDSAQSSGTSLPANTPAGRPTAAELEARMAKIKDKIAAKKAAAAAKAHNTVHASPNSSAVNSDTASEASAMTQINKAPLQSYGIATATESAADAATADSVALELKPTKVSGSVCSSSMSAMHTGKEPASMHSQRLPQTPDKQVRNPHVARSSQRQHASSTPMHHALARESSGASQAADQAGANRASLQAGHARTDFPAKQVPVLASNSVHHGSTQQVFSERQLSGPHTAPSPASMPSVAQMHNEEEVHSSQANQAHLDPHSWHTVLGQPGGAHDARIILDADANCNKHVQAASTQLMPSENAAEQEAVPCQWSQQQQESHAAAALAVTARRVRVLNSDMPLVLQHIGPEHVNISLQSTAPRLTASPPSNNWYQSVDPTEAQTSSTPSAAASQMTGRDAATFSSQHRGLVRPSQGHMPGAVDDTDDDSPMEIDAKLNPLQEQSSGTPFGNPPRAAFGHLYHQAPAMVVVSDDCTDMDVDDHM